MIIIDAVTPVSRVKTLTDELDGIQPGQSFVYANKDNRLVLSVLDRLLISGHSEPINNNQSRFFVACINSRQSKTDNKIKSMLPIQRREIMRRLHLTSSQIDDAVTRLGLVAVGNKPVIYKMP